ncbi:hypothetical protein [uncultured Draconibacterium sp.]|uniref:hypothetical protein n=1 Tax=uncultured Draconibacterium sp. TaxID=1573823 RepID=UPI0029C61F8B|nr:hypothetical protein [uncultured Draconibacterium sp.]
MKINKLYIIFFIATLFFAACDEYEDTVESSPAVPEGCQGVYFPSSNTAVFELEPTEATEITLTIARTVSTGSVDVPISVQSNTDDVFNVPATVNFADGKTEVDFTVPFPSAGEGTTYSLKLLVEGDQYINPYSAASPVVSTQVTRIKWEPVAEPMVYVDGTFSTFYGVSIVPMYVWAEKAQLGESVRYRFKNAYRVATGDWNADNSDYIAVPDGDGIYDGYPSVWPGEMDESQDWYTTIEIYDPAGTSGDVFMSAHELGVSWSYGMFSIGSVYGNISENIGSYPLGTLSNGVITFPANSLYISMADYEDGGEYPASTPTYIYLTKEAFIAANLKIEDFNDVEYEAIAGAVSEFASAAYSDNWSQTLAMAVDADPDNEDSEYKNLYYLSNLYAAGYGVAFYYEEGVGVTIPENQPIGTEVFGQDIYVSASEDIESSVEVNSKGVTIYTLGLIFHYADGTVVGEFAEKFFYSEDAVSYAKEDFIGNFVMSGMSQFGEADASMDVNIAEGDDENTFVITGITYAPEVLALFDPATSVMTITPQVMPDLVLGSGTYDVTLYTTDLDGGVSTTAVMNFTFNMQGDLIMTNTSTADGYLIRSEAAGGWLDGYYGLSFTPDASKSAGIATQSVVPFKVHTVQDLVQKAQIATNNFKVQGKISPKTLKKNINPVAL